jgi:DNA-binding NarL/FixJ family response regulator
MLANVSSTSKTTLRPIGVCLVEDHAGTRETLEYILREAPGIRFLRSYANGEEAMRKLPGDNPDVALIDINLPGISGIECVARLKTMKPDLSLLILTTHAESDLIFESLRAGASGYLLKNQAHAELIEAVQQAHDGGSPMSMQIARKVVRFFQQLPEKNRELEVLTAREQEILAALATGKLYKEIADQLGISLSTVRGHLHKVYAKLHVQSRTEAVVKYLGRGE